MRRSAAGCGPAVEFASLLIPELTERGSGGLLFAGGLSSVVPLPPLGGLALASAALRNYAITLNAALQPAGIYAGTISTPNEPRQKQLSTRGEAGLRAESSTAPLPESCCQAVAERQGVGLGVRRIQMGDAQRLDGPVQEGQVQPVLPQNPRPGQNWCLGHHQLRHDNDLVAVRLLIGRARILFRQKRFQRRAGDPPERPARPVHVEDGNLQR